jgi:hypothetical protein
MPASLAELLERKLTIRFAQDSLESALANIENEVRDAFPNLPFPWAIRILGADLEKNGITRNQQIRDFDQTDKTIAEILTAMVQRANPKAVTGPRDVNQQLVWVIGPDPDQPGRTILLITTRDAAAEKQYPVPAVFQP